MSADNGIYIGHFDDGYRVIHAQAIENIYQARGYMRQYFGGCAVYHTLEDAYIAAQEIESNIRKDVEEQMGYFVLEYGTQILELGEWPK